MAAVSLGMIVVAIVHFINNPANAPTLSLNDPRFVLFFMLAMAMLYYVVLGISRTRNREPQVVIDHDGIRLGFGRNSRFTWDDIIWVRLRRLALAPAARNRPRRPGLHRRQPAPQHVELR